MGYTKIKSDPPICHHIIQKIIGVGLPIIDTDDSFCWGLNSSGYFTTKSATWLAPGNRVSEQPPWQHKWIWSINTMPKIKVFFLWQLCHSTLLVRGTLLRRGCNIDPWCPLCEDEVESIDHLFWGCQSTSRVWELAVQHQWLPCQVLCNFN